MFSGHIKRLRLKNGFSQTQLAMKLGVTQGAVSQWESGKTRPDPDQLVQLARLFSVPLDYFVSELPARDLDGVVEMRRRAVPVIGTIACGQAITAEENLDGYADLPEGVTSDFALRCGGDSMLPTFRDGDLVLIRHQEDVPDGKVAAVMVDSDSATLKRIHHLPDGVILVPDNQAGFSPLVLREESAASVRILGQAVGFVRALE